MPRAKKAEANNMVNLLCYVMLHFEIFCYSSLQIMGSMTLFKIIQSKPYHV